MQKIIIAGLLGQDAQIAKVGDNIAINFDVAVNEKYGDNETTNWYACTLWRSKNKNSIADYLTKGTGVIIEGIPDIEIWMSKEKSVPQARIKITVKDLYFTATLYSNIVNVGDGNINIVGNIY
ncbi:MAG: single-stranded DNA-binding protein [Prevotellaceae bacterium]|jgi:single-stranded DNA-binding protein|nr:single-stranded DNA-binding protein [Prevotellaceae bacterium]